MSTPAFDDDPALLDRLAAALQELDEGREPDLERICGERADLLGPLSELLPIGRRLPHLQRSSAKRGELGGKVLAERYELESKLGAGAMGVVYAATDRELHRRVAIKVLHTLSIGGDEARVRFEREAEVLAAVRHPAVVSVYDRGQSPEGPFLVLELLEGSSLADLIDDLSQSDTAESVRIESLAAYTNAGSLAHSSYLRQVVAWVAELADGLAAVHAQGILHRDIKPSNVFLRTSGKPALLDFGIALSETHATLTLEGATVGTPAYMSPEALGAGEPSAALDVYGLTATLYHLVTLRAPYTGTPSQILAAVATKDPPRATSLRAGLHRDLQAILERGMARDPKRRYATAAELGDDLRAFLDHRPVRARRTTALGRAWRRARRSQAARGAALVSALLLVALAIGGWRQSLADQRRAAFFDAWRTVPGGLTLGGLELRRSHDDRIEAELRGLLDRALEAEDTSVEAHTVRASFAWDHGDARAAADDMERVAEAVDTKYARALAGAYRAAATGSGSPADARQSGAPPELGELPAPATRLDAWLAAFHARRADPYADVRHLDDLSELRDHAPSQELLLQHDLLDGDLTGAIERARRIEDLRGGRTATSAGWRGLALMIGKQYAPSLEALEEGLALSPLDHGMWINAGRSLWALERYDEAEAHLLRAIELKPTQLRTHESLVRVLLDAGRFDEALETLAAAPFPGDGSGEGARKSLQAEIAAERALALWDEGRPELAKETAKEAGRLFARAADLGGPHEIARAEIARALLEGSPSGVCSGILKLLVKEPLNRRRVSILLKWMPADLSPEETALVQRFLSAQHAALAGRAGT